LITGIMFFRNRELRCLNAILCQFSI
jgi:hypothetical protein